MLPCCLGPDLLPVYLGLTVCLLIWTVFAPGLDYWTTCLYFFNVDKINYFQPLTLINFVSFFSVKSAII